MTVTEIVMPGLVEPTGLLVQERALPAPDRARCWCGWRRPGSRSPSSRCAAASTTTSRRSRSCPATTWSARSRRPARGGPGDGRAAGRRGRQDRRLGHPRARRRHGRGAGARRGRPGGRRDGGRQRDHRLADAAPHREGPRRGRPSSCSARTAGSARSSCSSPARRRHGDRHRLGPPPRPRPRAWVRPPSTTATRTWPTGCARSHPTAWTRCSTTSAGRASTTPGGCCAAAARSSRTARAATKDDAGQGRSCRCSRCSRRLMAWNVLPNGRRAHFYNFWAGRRRPGALLPAPARGPDPGPRPACRRAR